MKTKISSGEKPKSSIPHCPYEIPISTIYNPSSKDRDVPVVSIYNPSNTRLSEHKAHSNFQRICLEKLKAQFHKDHRQKLEFYAALCLLTMLCVTGAVIVILHKSTTKDLLLVHGEFTILNAEYSSDLSHRNSSQFLQFSKEICHSVDSTFLVPGLSDFYRGCRVTAISPALNVHLLLTFANDPAVSIGQIGLTFIRGLRILHNKPWLGRRVVNVQSIGFMISGQEGVWGEWSEWSPCNTTLHVRTRTRPCLTRTGQRLASVDRCLLIPGAKSDLDIRKCSPDVAIETDASEPKWGGEASAEEKKSEELAGNIFLEKIMKSSIDESDKRLFVEKISPDDERSSGHVDTVLVREISDTRISPESAGDGIHTEAKVRKERTN